MWQVCGVDHPPSAGIQCAGRFATSLELELHYASALRWPYRCEGCACALQFSSLMQVPSRLLCPLCMQRLSPADQKAEALRRERRLQSDEKLGAQSLPPLQPLQPPPKYAYCTYTHPPSAKIACARRYDSFRELVAHHSECIAVAYVCVCCHRSVYYSSMRDIPLVISCVGCAPAVRSLYYNLTCQVRHPKSTPVFCTPIFPDQQTLNQHYTDALALSYPCDGCGRPFRASAVEDLQYFVYCHACRPAAAVPSQVQRRIGKRRRGREAHGDESRAGIREAVYHDPATIQAQRKRLRKEADEYRNAAYVDPPALLAVQDNEYFRSLPDHATRTLIADTVLNQLAAPQEVCAVCNWLLLVDEPRPVKLAREEVPNVDLLRGPPDLPRALREHYTPHPTLDGLLLAKQGVHIRSGASAIATASAAAAVTIAVCARCMCSLRANALPRYAIANGLYVGQLPLSFLQLTDAVSGQPAPPTKVEVGLVSPVLCMSSVTTIGRRPGAQRQIKGHVFTQKLDVQTIAKQLPLQSHEVRFRVLLVSSFTPLERAAALKDYVVRRAVVRDLLHFFCKNNPLYADVQLATERLAALPVSGELGAVIDEDIDANGEDGSAVPRPHTADSSPAIAATNLFGAVQPPSATVPATLVSTAAATATDNGATAAAAQSTESGAGITIAMTASIRIPHEREARFSSIAEDLEQLTENMRMAQRKRTAGRGHVSGSNTVAPADEGKFGADDSDDDGNADSPPPVPARPSGSGNADGKGKRYVVSASQQPVWDSDKRWLTMAFPDLFPFGRGGYDEPRRHPLSLEALFEHYLRLSTRQFQRPDFVLHCYDIRSQREMRQSAFVSGRVHLNGIARSAAPSATAAAGDVPLPPDNASANGERCGEEKRRSAVDAPGRIGVLSVSELADAAAFQRRRDHARKYLRAVPEMPASFSAVVKAFLQNVTRGVANAQHTPEHGMRMRSRMFGFSNELGPATWWMTVSPDDTLSVRLLTLATGDRPHSPPSSAVRYKLLADCPGAAALSFLERQRLIIRFIIGWDVGAGQALRRVSDTQSSEAANAGGLFGPCRAFTMAIETQARGSLHLHCLIWTFTANIETVRKRLAALWPAPPPQPPPAPTLASDTELRPPAPASSTSESTPYGSAAPSVDASADHESDSKRDAIGSAANGDGGGDTPIEPVPQCVTEAQHQLTALLDSAYCCGLSLRDHHLESLASCPVAQCPGKLKASEAALAKLRHKSRAATATHEEFLRCSHCKARYGAEARIERALSELLARSGRGSSWCMNVDAERLKWELQLVGAQAWGTTIDEREAKFAALQYLNNRHRHTHSCWKKKGEEGCRFHFPFRSVTRTFAALRPEGGQVMIGVRRAAPFAFLNQHSPELFGCMLSNTNLQFVKNAAISYYITMYQSKNSREEDKSNDAMIASFRRNIARREREGKMEAVALRSGATLDTNVDDRKQYVTGVSQVLSAIRGYTSVDTVSAQAAAYYLLGGRSYLFSHPTTTLPLQQGVAYLQSQEVKVSVGRGGEMRNAIMDYVCRPDKDPFTRMSWYAYVKRYMVAPRNSGPSRLRAAEGGRRHAASATASAAEKAIAGDTDAAVPESESSDDALEQANGASGQLQPARAHTLQRMPGPRKREGAALMSGHPQAQRLQVLERCSEHIVAIAGRRLANEAKLIHPSASDSPEQIEAEREGFAVAVMTMFLPFRTIDDIKQNDESFWEAYVRQRSTIFSDPLASTVFSNIQAFYHSADFADAADTDVLASTAGLEHADASIPGDADADDCVDDDGAALADGERGEIDGVVNVGEDLIHTAAADAAELDPIVMKLNAVGGLGRAVNGQEQMRVDEKDVAAAVAVYNDRAQLRNGAIAIGAGDSDTNGGDAEADATSGSITAAGTSAAAGAVEVRPTRVVELVSEAIRVITYKYDAARQELDGRNKRVPELAAVDYPTLKVASEHWTLNEEQHYAFVLLASAILDRKLLSIECERDVSEQIDHARRRLIAICAPRDTLDRENSAAASEPPSSSPDDTTYAHGLQGMFAFITGGAGTGKSRVIDATVDFARRWEASHLLVVTATSGAAAALIGASTWHSALGVAGMAGSKQDLTKASSKLLERWARIGVMIVDEIGMAGSKALATIDARLRVLRQNPTLRFGGVHFVVFGDFRQLPPVADLTFYGEPNAPAPLTRPSAQPSSAAAASNEKASKTTAATKSWHRYELSQRGHDLWMQHMNVGIELTVNERARSGGAYSQLLERFSRNQPTADDLRAINSRLLTPPPAATPRPGTESEPGNERNSSKSIHLQLPPAGLMIVVPTNKQRVSILQNAFTQFCTSNPTHRGMSWRERGALQIEAAVSVASGAEPPEAVKQRLRDHMTGEHKRQQKRDWSTDDSSGGGGRGAAKIALTGRLNCVLGTPMMVLANEQTQSGIVNGMVGTLVDVVVDEAQVRFTEAGIHVVDATHVTALILRYADRSWAERNLFPSLPAGCCPLAMATLRNTRTALDKQYNGQSYHFRVRQFPVTPAQALTGHKAQGATVSKLLIAEWKGVSEKEGKNVAAGEWLYTMLSRVRSIDDLFIMRKLPTNPKQYLPRTALLDELDRLRTRCFAITLQRLRQFDGALSSAPLAVADGAAPQAPQRHSTPPRPPSTPARMAEDDDSEPELPRSNAISHLDHKHTAPGPPAAAAPRPLGQGTAVHIISFKDVKANAPLQPPSSPPPTQPLALPAILSVDPTAVLEMPLIVYALKLGGCDAVDIRSLGGFGDVALWSAPTAFESDFFTIAQALAIGAADLLTGQRGLSYWQRIQLSNQYTYVPDTVRAHLSPHWTVWSSRTERRMVFAKLTTANPRVGKHYRLLIKSDAALHIAQRIACQR